MGAGLNRRQRGWHRRAASTVLLLSGMVLLRSCAPDDDHGTRPPVKPPVELPPAPQFDPDSAFAFVQKQVDFGPRVPGTAAHEACADWMVMKLKAFGADTVIEQTGTVTAFNGKKLPLRNIIARFHTERKDRILLLTHYDTRPMADKDKDPKRQGEPIPGANDGGSGVGVLLETARHLAAHPASEVGVDLFFTDAEDYGEPTGAMTQNEHSDTWCLGAQFWAKNPQPPGYSARFGILLDMVGARDARFYKEAFSMQTAGHVVNKVWRTAAAIGHGDRFVNEVKYFVGVDDHVYIHRGRQIPTIDIIEYNEGTMAFTPAWHTHDDDMENIDPATLKAVGQTVLEVAWKER